MAPEYVEYDRYFNEFGGEKIVKKLMKYFIVNIVMILDREKCCKNDGILHRTCDDFWTKKQGCKNTRA